jgi:hypothetical protein
MNKYLSIIINMFLSTNQKNKVNHPPDKINILAKKVVLFTNARNETHIKEWATHHLLLGFSKIVIFDHKSDVPLKTVFKNFDKRVKVISVSHLENPIKMPLMNKAAELLVKHTDFQCFSKVNTDVNTFDCTIFEAYWTRETTDQNQMKMILKCEIEEYRYMINYIILGALGLFISEIKELHPDFSFNF